ncbi:MAG: peptide deformylase [Myxococcota bacterium]|jgi:peptide deformylase
MDSSSYLRLALVAALVAVLAQGCTPARSFGRHVDGHPWTPAEEALIMQGGEGVPMRVVGNDSTSGEKWLRAPSLPVPVPDTVADRLTGRLQATGVAEKGVGVAAPQVGVGRRAIVVQRVDIEPEKPWRGYLNPVIVRSSPDVEEGWEGCLSVPAGFGRVSRPVKITVVYQTQSGAIASEDVSGFAARIFQHETDHLDGILFIDRMEPGELVPKDRYREMRRREKEAGTPGK